jgi:ATP-binding cassette subfamily B protein
MTMMLVTSAWLAGIMIVLLAVIVLPLWALGRRVRKMSRTSQDKVADTSAMAGEVLNAITTVQAFTREPHEQQRFNTAVETAFQEAKKRITMRSLLTAMAIVMSFGVIVFVLWIGAQQVTAGVMTLGELTQFVLYAVLIAGSIGALSETWGDLQRAAGAMERLVELMQATPDLVYQAAIASQAQIPFQALSPAPTTSQVDAMVFSSVSFAYPSRPDFMAIKDLSFAVRQGARYALVGPSGAGKSSLVQILLGFREDYSGDVLVTVSGQVFNLRQIDKKSWRKLISWMPQEPHFPVATVIQLLQFTNPLTNQADLVKELQRVGLEISDLPNGVDTQLGTINETLSIGQKRKIALARALLKPAKLLILDEPTASVDELSQKRIDELIQQQAQSGQTVLVISHRSQTFLTADHLLRFDRSVRV